MLRSPLICSRATFHLHLRIDYKHQIWKAGAFLKKDSIGFSSFRFDLSKKMYFFKFQHILNIFSFGRSPEKPAFFIANCLWCFETDSSNCSAVAMTIFLGGDKKNKKSFPLKMKIFVFSAMCKFCLSSEFWISIHNDRNCPILDNYDNETIRISFYYFYFWLKGAVSFLNGLVCQTIQKFF